MHFALRIRQQRSNEIEKVNDGCDINLVSQKLGKLHLIDSGHLNEM